MPGTTRGAITWAHACQAFSHWAKLTRPLAFIDRHAMRVEFAPMSTTPNPTPFTVAELFTDTDGRARFRDHALQLTEGTPISRLSALAASGADPSTLRTPAHFASSR